MIETRVRSGVADFGFSGRQCGMAGQDEVLERICARPEMFLGRVTYDAVVAVLVGLDLGSQGGALCGFREWLIVRCDGGNNLVWEALVLRIAFPDQLGPLEPGGQEDLRAVEVLFELMNEFVEDRASPDGLRRIFLAYESWLRRQSWYNPTSPHWIEFPSGRSGA